MKTQTNITYITFFCVVFCFCWSTQDKINVRIPTQMVLESRQQAQKCEEETGVPAAHLKKIIDKTLPDDTPNKQFFLCVVVNTGFGDNDGHLNVDRMVNFEVDGNVEDYKNTIKECNKIDKENPAETLFVTSDCVHSKYHFMSIAPQ